MRRRHWFIYNLVLGRNCKIGGEARDTKAEGTDLPGAIILVQQQRPMEGGMVTRLILRPLSPLELVPLIVGGQHSEEQEARRNGSQELTLATSEKRGGRVIM